MRRSGSDLFDRPGGASPSVLSGSMSNSPKSPCVSPFCHAVGWTTQTIRRRGFVEDTRLWLELVVSAVFDGVRTILRKILFIGPRPKPSALRKKKAVAVSAWISSPQ